MKALSLALVLGAASLPPLTSQAASSVETVGALLLRVQEESAAPLVRHCVERLPDMKRPLEGEYARFRKRFRKATASLRAGIGSAPELSKPATPDLIREFEAMGAQDVAQTAALDPLAFCSSLKENLSKATRESMQKSMESAFAQYKAVARRGL